MAHYAQIEDGVVIQVIVANTQQWCEVNLGGTWVQTSYNTKGGVNTRIGGEALHKNFGAVGYLFDGVGFYAPQPYPSWTKDVETYLWQAPVAMPTDDKIYTWNEDTTSWVELVTQ